MRMRIECKFYIYPRPDERMSMSFTIAAGPRQRSHSQVRVPRDPWPHFTLSASILPQPGGPGPRIYIPQEQGGLVILPGTGFPFRRLLRLAGLRWSYSNPPPHGVTVPTSEVKVKITLRLAVYRQILRLGVKPYENHDKIIFFSTETLR
jgi:hypothetical protein